MKKILFCVIFAEVLTACSEQQNMEFILEDELETIADGYISKPQAAEIANDFAARLEKINESRSSSLRHVSSARNVSDLKRQNSRAGEESLIYAVNYDDNQGFALISKKQIDNPVLAFIPEGSYSDETANKIGGLQIFINDASIYLDKDISIDDKPDIINDSISPSIGVPIPDDRKLCNFVGGNPCNLLSMF